MIEFLFSQYKNHPTYEIVLELCAIFFGLVSVWMSKKNNVLVFPTGLVNTSIYVFLLWKWSLLGDMMINAYYVIMSLYGWYLWTRKQNNEVTYPIATCSQNEYKKGFFLFIGAIVFVLCIYQIFNKFTHWTSYLDTLITGIFFVGMWLMAKRKIENWIFWIIGNIISIPLYFAKGYTFTSLQYLLFTIIAYYGYKEWKGILQKQTLN